MCLQQSDELCETQHVKKEILTCLGQSRLKSMTM